MRVLVCPTAFKESFGAREAADAMAEGVRRWRPSARVARMPLSDGGPGLLEALSAAGEARVETRSVSDPLGQPVTGRLLWTDRRHAVVESSDACGLHLLPGGGRPLEAHTRGVGELVRAAVEAGAAEIHVGLGGSATTDGGTGMARVFGYRFLDAEGRPLPPGGGPLRRLARIEPGAGPDAAVVALADVETALTGMAGAARTFGPQKGASAEEVELLVEGLERLGRRLEEDLAADVADLPGSGAAGGLGAGCAAFLGARIVGGADWVLERVGFERSLARADRLVTGEGAFDASSGAGKVTQRVLERARRAEVPVTLVCGRIEADPPAGVVARAGDGTWLSPDDLARLTAEALAAG